MTDTAYQARQVLLSRSEEIVTTYVDKALAAAEEGDLAPLGEVFRKLIPMMKIDDDRNKITAFKEGLATEVRIENIFNAVAAGDLSLPDALASLDLLTAGCNVTEAQELREALKALSS